MHSGQLKVSHAAANGQEQILRTVTDGDVVGERAFLTGHRPNDLAVALEESRMCVFDHADLAVLLRDYPDISQRMLRTLSDRLSSVERLLAAITSSDVNARVAAYLLDLPGTMRDGAATVRLPMAKQEIAAYLGTTPETLSRRLAALSASGLIELHGRREVTILDIDALEHVATPR
ncbi:Crp/Fnr family transcriptional regulator [Kocuria carniphila]